MKIYSLEVLSCVLWQDVKGKMLHYGQLFSRLFFKHLTTETEVHIKNGMVTSDSEVVLNKLECEKHILQYRGRIIDIYRPWCAILCGQPIYPGVENQVLEIISVAILSFEELVYSIQKIANKVDNRNDNAMCKRLCSTARVITNFTGTEIPLKLEQLLSHGINFVPTAARSKSDLLDIVENDLKEAAIKFFRSNAMYYPRINSGMGLQDVILQLVQQTPSNTTKVNFYFKLYEGYIMRISQFLNDLNFSHLENYETIKSLVPKNFF